jgi:uncharacterized membrane protein
MFERRTEVRDTATRLAEALAHDVKLRDRLGAALAHAAAARRRANRQTGVTGLALRLSTDRELRAHLQRMAADLRSARKRLERKRSHRLRNTVLVLAGAGAATVVLVPQVRRRLVSAVGRPGGAAMQPEETSPPAATIDEQIRVDVPISTAYNQWTQFEDFPLFMEGVEDVKQLDDTTLHWVASVAGKRAEWDAKILRQEPDREVTWESLDGKQTRGTVRFEEAGPSETLIRLTMSYRPEGLLERVGSAAGLDIRRVRGDLERFKELIESRRVESGAWRGEVKGGQKT